MEFEEQPTKFRCNSDISVRMRHGIVVKCRFLTEEPRIIKDGRETSALKVDAFSDYGKSLSLMVKPKQMVTS